MLKPQEIRISRLREQISVKNNKIEEFTDTFNLKRSIFKNYLIKKPPKLQRKNKPF
jgi:hypothetical protein